MSAPDRETLAARYRRLLRWYPADHRDHYEEEMLGVLLDDAPADRRRPTVSEAAVLIVTGLRTRMTGTGVALGHPRWRESAGAAGVLMVLGLAVKALHPVVLVAGIAVHRPVVWGVITPGAALLAAVWTLAAGLALTPLRRTAAIAGCLAAGVQAAVLGSSYLEDPVAVLDGAWVVAAAVIAAACLAVARKGTDSALARKDMDPALARKDSALAREDAVSARARKAFAAGALLAVLGGFGTYAFTRVDAGGFPEPWVRAPFDGYLIYRWRLDNLLADVFLLAAAVAVVIGIRSLAPAVRRRLAAFLAPPVVLIVVVDQVYAGFARSSPRFDPPVLLTAGEWAGLVAVPLLTFLLAAALVHRVERLAELVELGRQARRG